MSQQYDIRRLEKDGYDWCVVDTANKNKLVEKFYIMEAAKRYANFLNERRDQPAGGKESGK